MARNDKDLTEKLLEDYNDVFADIVNGLLFNGRPVVEESELITATPMSTYKADGKLHEQDRDVAKYWLKGNVVISLLGLENQTKEDPDMTLRLPSYDGAGYREQMLHDPKDEKGRRIGRNPRYPVITLVLYYGSKKWKTPLNLKGNIHIPEGLDKYVNDYKMNLFEISFLTEKQVNLFHSDFKPVADFFVHRRTDPDYKGSDEQIKHVSEVLDLLAALTGDRRFEDKVLTERRSVSVKDIIDRWIDTGKEEGLKEVAIKLIRKGQMTDADIADVCGLTEDQVKKLRKDALTMA